MISIRPTLIATSLLALAPAFAQAQDRLFIASAETGSEYSNYGLVGVIAPLPGSSLGKGWVARAFLDGLTYRYESGTRDIDATSNGAEISAGWMDSDAKGWWGLYAGPAWRHTDLSPDDLANQSRGDEVSLRLSAEIDRAIDTSWRAGWLGSYSALADNGYWTRLRVQRNIGGKLHLGPEGVLQGSDEYRAWQVGLALTGIEITESASLGFHTGLRKGDEVSYAPYVGLEFVTPF